MNVENKFVVVLLVLMLVIFSITVYERLKDEHVDDHVADMEWSRWDPSIERADSPTGLVADRVDGNVTEADMIFENQPLSLFPLFLKIRQSNISARILDCEVPTSRESDSYHQQLNHGDWKGYSIVPGDVYPQPTTRQSNYIVSIFKVKKDLKLISTSQNSTIEDVVNGTIYTPSHKHYDHFLRVVFRDLFNISGVGMPEFERMNTERLSDKIEEDGNFILRESLHSDEGMYKGNILFDLSEVLEQNYGNAYPRYFLVRRGEVVCPDTLDNLVEILREYRRTEDIKDPMLLKPITSDMKEVIYKVWEMENERRNKTRNFDKILTNYSCF